MPPRVADGEGKRREITLSVTVGDSSPEGRADCNARSVYRNEIYLNRMFGPYGCNVRTPEKIIVSAKRLSRDVVGAVPYN